jgi:hypothetical protein
MANLEGNGTRSISWCDFAAIEKVETTRCYPISTDTCTRAESGRRIMEVVDGIVDELRREWRRHGERSVQQVRGVVPRSPKMASVLVLLPSSTLERIPKATPKTLGALVSMLHVESY